MRRRRQDHWFLFLILLIFFAASPAARAAGDYIKLPLFRKSTFPTAAQALASDSLRLSFLAAVSSSSSSSPPSASPPAPAAALSAPVVSGASSGQGQYFVDLHLGSPPQRLHLVADTGSDLLWSRCSPCRPDRADCSLLHPTATAFLPRLSSSFRPFHCFNSACSLVPHPSPSPPCRRRPLHSPCRYHYSYADRSSSSGFFSHDIVSINSTGAGSHGRSKLIRLRSVPFGCAFNVTSSAASGAALTGVLGLGRGPISFPSHAAGRFGDAFSYCLVDYTLAPPPTSFLLIGSAAHSSAVPPGGNLTFTPLLSNPLSPTYYYVRVLSVAVDGATLPVDPGVWELDQVTGVGGTVVDSGTTLSFVPPAAYRAIVRAMALRIPAVARVPKEGRPAEFDLCVNDTAAAVEGVRTPKLSFRLHRGAEMSPPAGNYFIEAAEGVRCLAVQPVIPTGPGFAVIGNLMQQGFLMVFDRAGSRLGFTRTGCAAEVSS